MRKWINLIEAETIPSVLFHGTPSNSGFEKIESFKPLTHFGTRRSAEDRLIQKFLYTRSLMGYKKAGFVSGEIYSVHLNLKNPCKIRDIKDNATAYKLVDLLYYTSKKITNEEREEMFREQCSDSIIVKVLSRKGYDGIVYKNIVEDAGSQSYMNFSPSQVTIISVDQYSRAL